MYLLSKFAKIILTASFIVILLIAFDAVTFTRMEKLVTYFGFILSVLFLLLGRGGGKEKWKNDGSTLPTRYGP